MAFKISYFITRSYRVNFWVEEEVLLKALIIKVDAILLLLSRSASIYSIKDGILLRIYDSKPDLLILSIRNRTKSYLKLLFKSTTTF